MTRPRDPDRSALPIGETSGVARVLGAAGWRAAGREVAVGEHRIFVVQRDPRDAKDAPAILFLHGFPTSSLDWAPVVPALLGRGFRLVLFDFLGFGFSSKPRGHAYSLLEQADIAEAAARAAGLGRLHVVAHDMGDSVALELVRREAFRARMRGLVLLNGSVLLEHYRPLLSQRLLRVPLLGAVFARLATRRLFVRQISSVFGADSAPPRALLDEMWEVIQVDRGSRNYHRVIRYLDERRVHERAWLDALAGSGVPLLLLWGTDDPVAVPRIADEVKARRPDARLVRMSGIGHYPQLEDPDRVASEIAAFVEKAGWP